MIADRGPLDDAFDLVASFVKQLVKRLRLRSRKKAAPKRRRKKRSASSKAAAALARKRWSAVKKAELARKAKLAERRLKRAAAKADNVIPFKKRAA